MFTTYINTPEEHRDKTPEEIREYFNKYDPKTHRRYHDLGKIREYEPDISAFGTILPVSDAFEIRQNSKENRTK